MIDICYIDRWMRELNVTFAKVRLNRQAWATVMRQMALVARMKHPSSMAALGNLGSELAYVSVTVETIMKY